MTDAEWLEGKIPTWDEREILEQRDYLLQQMNWLGENYHKFVAGEYQYYFSCLLEAIENAQKEMSDE